MIHLKCGLDIEQGYKAIFFENQNECTILLTIKNKAQLRKILIIEPNERLDICLQTESDFGREGI